MATLKNYEITAQRSNGTIFTDTFYCANERAARHDFWVCYRHDDYTILSVEPEAGDLSEAELKKLVAIAQENIPAVYGREDLEAMDSDDLDFFETAVWCLKDALVAAYKAGKEAGRKGGD